MYLIIDVGNTRMKAAVYSAAELIHFETLTVNDTAIQLSEIVSEYGCSHAVLSSVGNLKKEVVEQLEHQIPVLKLSSNTPVPFENRYKTPDSLGVDRIALVAAAHSTYPSKNVLVIDAGSCITYDFISDRGHYFGGSISPGLQMRYRSLNQFTEGLPLLSRSDNVTLLGDSTESCIHSGIICGVITEIDGIINQYRKKNKDLTVVLTGGDSNFLANRLKNSIFANPNFILEGLNSILTYNLV